MAQNLWAFDWSPAHFPTLVCHHPGSRDRVTQHLTGCEVYDHGGAHGGQPHTVTVQPQALTLLLTRGLAQGGEQLQLVPDPEGWFPQFEGSERRVRGVQPDGAAGGGGEGVGGGAGERGECRGV